MVVVFAYRCSAFVAGRAGQMEMYFCMCGLQEVVKGVVKCVCVCVCPKQTTFTKSGHTVYLVSLSK